MQLDEAIRRFLDSATVEKNLTRPTLRAYSGDLQLFRRTLGDRTVGSITTDDLRRYVEALESSKRYQDTTIRRRLATVKVLFRFLEEEGILEDSPARRLRGRYAIVRRLPRVMSLRELKALLRACRRELIHDNPPMVLGSTGPSLQSRAFRARRDLAIFELLFATGMRIGELVALDIVDVNLRERTVRILGKGRRERMAFISSDETVRRVKDYMDCRANQPVEGLALFLNRGGGRLSIYSVENAFRRHCRQGRIRSHFTPHCLRHTMATMLLNNGADIRSVQEILGHRTILTTQIYTEVSVGQKRRTMMRFHQRNRMKLDPAWQEAPEGVRPRTPELV